MGEENKNQSLNGEGVHQHQGEPKDKEKRLHTLRNLGIAALAVLLYLLLLDGAVETFLGGSSMRWWVGGTVAAYLVLTIMLWRRLGWATRAALSLFVLLGLLAATTWRPDGLSQGMMLVRQPTAVVLSAITAAAIAFAVIIVVRAKVVPIWVSFIVGLFAIYGIAAFVLGIKHGMPYSTLFHGNSLWERLPFWLQGAYVGTLFIIPAALLFQIEKAIRISRQAFRGWAVPMSTLSLSLLIVVAGIKAPAGSSLVMKLDGGRLEATLTQRITEENEPVSPTGEFPEDAEKIYLTFKSDLTESASVSAELVAVNVEGMEPEQKVSVSYVYLSPGERGAVEFEPPRGGFSTGDYKVDLALGDSPPQSLSFKVVPILPPAKLVEEIEEPHGFNIVRAALGGRIESFTSEYDDDRWAAANLIDGVPFTLREGRGGLNCKECGWSSRNDSVPQEIVFSFYQKRQALISAVVVNTETWETRQQHNNIAKHVEVWISTTSPTAGFRKIAGVRLHRHIGEQVITFSPTEAKYVKLRLLSNHGGSYTQVGEVRIIEAKEGTASILADFPKNLAFPALGGAVVRYTSQYNESNGVQNLVDERNDTKGWRSADNYLPQEFVFAFRGDREALIDQIVLNPKTEHDPATWPKLIKVSVSTKNPLDGFQEVRLCTLAQESRDQGFPIGRKARFLKLRILENFGGDYTSLGEVKLLEGSSVDYESVLLETRETAISAHDTLGISWVDTVDARMEIESNDTPMAANPLVFEQFTKGVIDPLGEEDYFKFTVSGQGSILTLDLIGQPNIRTSLTLLDSRGVVRKQFDPGRLPGERQTFSWAVAPSTYRLRVTEPPISLVLIWDTSPSMQGRSEDLRQAIESYLDQVQPSERVNLIRFSGEVEVLVPEFTSDRNRLKAAVQGKIAIVGSGTSFYDAVAKGIELLEQLSGNRAIVVMTDGGDNRSRLQYPGFWRLLAQKRIRLYTIGLGDALELQLPQLGTSCRRMLSHVALATNGRAFFAKTSEELKGYYQQILEELRTISSYYLRPTLDRGPGYLTVLSTGERIPGVDAPSQIELILDASGSMIYQHQKIDGRLKMEVAKDVMEEIIEELPDDIQVALRVYGRRIRQGRPGACQDSELLFPFQKIDKARLIGKVRQIRALGTTPIAYSLRQVAKDFGNTPGEKIVILVTDGKEECKGNPTAAVSELLNKGLKVRVNVVGFALAEPEVKQEMCRVAELTGGRFFDAKDAKGLRQAIRKALAVPYDVQDAAGAKVASGYTGQGAIKVPEGIYTVVVNAAGKPITVSDVRVVQSRFTRVELEKEGQEIATRVTGPLRKDEAQWASQAEAQAEHSQELLENVCDKIETPEQTPDTQLANMPRVPPVRPDPRVRHAQQLLQQMLLTPGPADGFWGRKTKAAIVEFQRQKMKQSEPTGQLDDLTYAALQEAEAEGWIQVPWSIIDEAMRKAGQPEWERKLANAPTYITTKLTPALRTPSAEAKIVALFPPGKKVKVVGPEQELYGNYFAVAWENQTVVFVLRKDMVPVTSEEPRQESMRKDAATYSNRGLSYARLGDHQQAIRDYTHAMALDERFAPAYQNRGASYSALGDYQQAIRDYTRAIDLGLGEGPVYFNRGWSYAQLGDHQRAIRDFQIAARLGHTDAQDYLRSSGVRW